MKSKKLGLAVVAAVVVVALGEIGVVIADGEPDGSFPSWEERWLHQLHNRARSDPEFEMAVCGSDCAEAACYGPVAPLTWVSELNHSARFHSANLVSSGCGLSPRSPCDLLPSIGSLYPDSCNGNVACACTPSTLDCLGTSPFARISLFGGIGFGENVLWFPGDDLTAAFYLMLFQPTSDPTCGAHPSFDNGYRYNILSESPNKKSLGSGRSEPMLTFDFGDGPSPGKIPSGSHYPLQAASVDVWVNWYDSAGPSAAAVNVEGACHPLTLERGNEINGSWTTTIDGVASGCFRYYFEFLDSTGVLYSFPSSGSLAIGSGAGCPDWEEARPATCLPFSPSIFLDDFESGDTSAWSAVEP